MSDDEGERRANLLERDNESRRINDVVVDPNISASKTIILKAVTHRGTQTVIQCDPYLAKEDFIDMIIKARL